MKPAAVFIMKCGAESTLRRRQFRLKESIFIVLWKK